MGKARVFRGIAEASVEVGVSQRVLRAWELEIPWLRILRNANLTRLYRSEDIDFIKGIRILLHEEHYTMKGIHQIIRRDGLNKVRDLGAGVIEPPRFSQD